jgi:electron transfer flavoprotein alpha subunit
VHSASPEPLPLRLLALVPLDAEEAVDLYSPVAAAASIASQCGATVDAIVLGRAPQDEHGRSAFDAGADRVWLVSHPRLAPVSQADQLIAAFEAALSDPAIDATDAAVSLLPTGAIGEEVASRLAIRRGAIPLGRCQSIEISPAGGIVVRRPAYGGRAEVTLSSVRGPCFAALHRPEATAPAVRVRAQASSQPVHVQLNGSVPTTDHIAHTALGERLPPVEGAKVVVCGGRGMAGPDGFKLLEALAGCLGGALGGSLPTVDSGWVPVARQVGQSGKYVTAALYIGVGVSGTPQHMAGVGPQTRIVAINTDPGADIFRYAEIGLVADWKDVLPALIERLRRTDG